MRFPKPSHKQTIIWTVLFLVGYFLLSQYYTWVKPTSTSYSFTQQWWEYYSIEDWNMSSHAVADINQDGEKDLITLMDSCAYVSGVTAEQIPDDRECEQPGMTHIVFPNQPKLGQKLVTAHPYKYYWLMKSYLVKTQTNHWRYYELNGLQVRVFQLDENGIFQEVSPTLSDRIDTFTYQVTHLGVVVTIMVMSSISQMFSR